MTPLISTNFFLAVPLHAPPPAQGAAWVLGSTPGHPVESPSEPVWTTVAQIPAVPHIPPSDWDSEDSSHFSSDRESSSRSHWTKEYWLTVQHCGWMIGTAHWPGGALVFAMLRDVGAQDSFEGEGEY